MSSEFEALIQGALGATRNARLDEAEHLLLKAAGLEPGAAIPHFLMGANFAQAGLNDQAEAAYTSCLSRDPRLEIARFQLGLLQVTSGRPIVAQATWEPLLLLGDSSPLANFAQGFIEILKGDKPAAERFIHRGIALNSKNPSLNEDMRGVLSRLNLAGAAAGTALPADVSALSRDSSKTQEMSEHFLISAYGKS
jgi:Flp pilus assembly protein TadD